MIDLIEATTKLKELLNVNDDTFTIKNRHYPSYAIDDPKKISYFKKDIDTPWDKDTRKKQGIMIKPGKFFRYVKPDLRDNEIQKLVSAWYVIIGISQNNGFKLKISKNIKKYYHQNCYNGAGGTLGNSCMRMSQCQDWLDFYGYYDCSILVLRNDDGRIKGRALLWHNVYFPYLSAAHDFLDRIYTNDCNDVMLFMQYAEKNKLVRKEHQSMSAKSSFVHGGQTFKENIEIKPLHDFDVYDTKYPYLDTMAYMTETGGLCNTYHDDFYIELMDTNGNSSVSHSNSTCADCGENFDIEDEGIYMDDHGFVCDSCAEYYAYCERCERYEHQDYITYINDRAVCDHCRNNYFTECAECGNYHSNDDLIEGPDNEIYCDDCYDMQYICDICNTETYDKNKHGNCPDCQDKINYTELIKIREVA